MRFTLAFACQLVAALAAETCNTTTSRHQQRVLYVQDNNPAGNFLISALISEQNGTLSSAVKTPTGGYGHELLIVNSADSLLIYENYLFTVNGGSNTLSMFYIDPEDPLNPRLVGEPAPTLGLIPISVAYSPKLDQACVVNGGFDSEGVTCFSVHPKKGLSPLGGFRHIPQPANAAPLPPGINPKIFTADIMFNPSQTAIFVTLSNSTVNPGFIYVYPIENNLVSEIPTINVFPNITVPFSLYFLDHSDEKLFISDANFGSYGSDIMNVSPSYEITQEQGITIPRSGAVCWTVPTKKYPDIFFVTDALTAAVSVVNVTLGETLHQANFTTPAFGGSDGASDRDWFYSLTVPYVPDFTSLLGSPQVLVWDITPIERGEEIILIQSFDLFASVGVDQYEVMGMSVWPKELPVP